jgi:hypothetical protein
MNIRLIFLCCLLSSYYPTLQPAVLVSMSFPYYTTSTCPCHSWISAVLFSLINVPDTTRW